MARPNAPAKKGAGGGGGNSHRGEWNETPEGWELGSAPAAPGQVREEGLQREAAYPHTQVALRNGAGDMALSKAALSKAELEGLLQRDPTLFQALRALADGRRADVSRQQLQELKDEEFVARSGRVRGELQMVLKASYEETEKGPSIVEPYDMTNPDHAAAVRRYMDEGKRSDEKADAVMQRLMREWNAKQGRS